MQKCGGGAGGVAPVCACHACRAALRRRAARCRRPARPLPAGTLAGMRRWRASAMCSGRSATRMSTGAGGAAGSTTGAMDSAEWLRSPWHHGAPPNNTLVHVAAREATRQGRDATPCCFAAAVAVPAGGAAARAGSPCRCMTRMQAWPRRVTATGRQCVGAQTAGCSSNHSQLVFVQDRSKHLPNPAVSSPLC